MAKIKSKGITTAKSNADGTSNQSWLDRLQSDVDSKNTYLNIILGALIVVVVGVLLFNYFNKPAGNVGPAGETADNQPSTQSDVDKDQLPGKYTVKEGDTLYTIAQSYYGQDQGDHYSEIATANKLDDVNSIETGQVLEIPKIENSAALAMASPSPAVEATVEPTVEPSSTPVPTIEPTTAPDTMVMSPNPAQPVQGATGGAENETVWGEKISGNTYTVQPGDWLSKIAGRTYGDIYKFEDIAKANNISDPNIIEPGMVLKLPR